MVSMRLLIVRLGNIYCMRTTIWIVSFTFMMGIAMISSSFKDRPHLKVKQIKDEPVQDPFPMYTVRETSNISFSEIEQSAKLKNYTQYVINWYNPPPFLRIRREAINCGFEKCKYKNCIMTFSRKFSAVAHAVLFDGRWVSEKVGFVRPPGQVWIFAAHETPLIFEYIGKWWKQPQWRYGFNWTMTYDKDNTDIYLPYGEIRKYPNYINRDYEALALLKTQGALMINSHCNTSSYRETFVLKLSKYIPVTVLGQCGKPWNCGTHYIHDKCFDLLNTTYKYFLAFENAFCNQYFTEKVYENFNYDIILVVRGGRNNETMSLFPKGAVISTDSFKSIDELGKYLAQLSNSKRDYAEMLKRKSQYYSPGYTEVYQRAMCDLCERMNNQEKYHKVIPDIVHWAYHKQPCVNASDLH